MRLFQKFRGHGLKAAAAGTALAVAGSAHADGVDLSSIGTTAATEIAKFAVMVSAIGMALLSVVIVIQGFRIAYSMIKAGK
ncbi:hypothetical protein H9Q10_01965 [Eikenella sp. S3360]|uniref:Phage coat protein n=1 Tax=Eikenella glucosivorans TaxID=2766967 RepID=A0ABS0N814_9NEIS|nr:hypothetical protein [Eikenella glucosivorans]MBH5328438.1 hypothetical protein [Eikenella glucosivorans]